MPVPPIPKRISKAEQFFKEELRLIKSVEIKKFVLECFDKHAADYFWSCPCSTTGKYHPQYALGNQGLIRHVKSAVWWGLELFRALPFELQHIPTIQDEIVAALLLHDIRKNGDALNVDGFATDRNATKTHGVKTAGKIGAYFADDTFQGRIITAIAGHMGIWTEPPDFQPYKLQDETLRAFTMLIHLADYCASRKVDEMLIKLEKEKNV